MPAVVQMVTETCVCPTTIGHEQGVKILESDFEELNLIPNPLTICCRLNAEVANRHTRLQITKVRAYITLKSCP